MFRRRRFPESRTPTSRRVGERLASATGPRCFGGGGVLSRPGSDGMRGRMALVRTPSVLASGLLACAVVVAACGPADPPSPSPVPTSSLVAPIGGQTETEWGLIWDTLPDDFPVSPGSVTSDEAADGPASATLTVDVAKPDAVVGWYLLNLIAAGHAVDDSGTAPLEDGELRPGGVRTGRLPGPGDRRTARWDDRDPDPLRRRVPSSLRRYDSGADRPETAPPVARGTARCSQHSRVTSVRSRSSWASSSSSSS